MLPVSQVVVEVAAGHIHSNIMVRLMDKILHDPKDPKLWELWYIPYYGSCRILSINSTTNRDSNCNAPCLGCNLLGLGGSARALCRI